MIVAASSCVRPCTSSDSVWRRCCSVRFSGTLRKSNELEEFKPRQMVQCGISSLAAALKRQSRFGKVTGSGGRRCGAVRSALPQEATLTFSCCPNQGLKKPQVLACHREKGIIEPSSGGDGLAVRTGRCHGFPRQLL